MGNDGDEASGAPRFECIGFSDGEDDPGQLGFWCPWCETPHLHGRFDEGHVEAHCVGDRRSPLASTGYELHCTRQGAARADRDRALTPSALMLDGPPLRSMIGRAAGVFRSAMLQALLAVSPTISRRDTAVRNVKGRASIVVFDSGSWVIAPASAPDRPGRGFIHLAAVLYGLPAGVAAVRILEAASFETLDAEAALAVQAAVDAWIARGAAARGRVL